MNNYTATVELFQILDRHKMTAAAAAIRADWKEINFDRAAILRGWKLYEKTGRFPVLDVSGQSEVAKKGASK